ncbi:MAG: SRPBCC domain-containing protein [Patescibacteria group bacterium]|nr:SRPBCC domain-containing protein [Patescibacteria group bacterium]
MQWIKNVFLFLLFGVGIFICVIGAVLIIHATSNYSYVKTFEEEILIKSQAKDVYNFILDPQKVQEWWSGTREVILLTQGEPGKNTKYFLVTNQGDVSFSVRSLSKDKSIELSYEFKDNQNIGNTQFTLIEQNKNTTLRVKTSIRFIRQNERFWSPVTTYNLRKKTKKDLEKLKILIEK